MSSELELGSRVEDWTEKPDAQSGVSKITETDDEDEEDFDERSAA